jgi:hypothetical protein
MVLETRGKGQEAKCKVHGARGKGRIPKANLKTKIVIAKGMRLKAEFSQDATQ